MIICVYGEPLTVFTSGTPMRGLFMELMKIRKHDTFKVVLRSQIPQGFKDYFNLLENFPNCHVVFKGCRREISNLLALVGYSKYNHINVECDFYINAGNIDSMFLHNVPQIGILTDLSLLRNPKNSSVPWHGRYIFKNSLKNSIKYLDSIICISNYTKLDLINLYPQIQEKISTIYNGIQSEWFDSSYEKLEVDTITDSENGYWIWYGYMSKRKNIMNLLKAYELLFRIKQKLPKVLLVGKVAPNQTKVLTLIDNRLFDSVRIIPHQDIYKLKYLVKRSRGVLIPSYYEGFGMPIIEAFSQGIPVMHSNVSSLPEIAGGLGIECEPLNIYSIRNALLSMIDLNTNDELIEKRKQWAKGFTYENAAKKFSHIIDLTSSYQNI
jgi:O-antigen biosynthesis alpha-1,2-mannosyltransferase